MPSASMINVSLRLQNSSKRWRSAELRAKREISSPKIAPTSPRHTRLTTSLNPVRPDPLRPDNPRSVSIVTIADAGHPRRAASSASAYWRAVDSVCSRTCISVDCRTYTTASRSRCRRVIVCGPLIVCASSSGDRRHEHIGHGGHQIRAGSASHHSRKLPSSKELEIDRRDLRQRGVEATGRLHAPRHRFDRIRRDVQQAAAFARAHRHIDVGAVQLPLGAAAPGLAAPAHLAVQGPAQRRFHIRHGAREAGATRWQLSHAQGAQSGLVFHSDTRLVPSSRPVKRGPSAATTTARSRSTSTVRGLAAGAAPRSVKCSGRVTVFNGPASQTYTRPRVGSRYVRSNRIEIRWPASGWYGCVTTSESKRSLYADAVCSDRRNRDGTLFSVFLRNVDPTQRLRAVLVTHEAMVERRDVPPHVQFVLPVRDLVHARARVFPQTLKGCR